MARPPNSWVWQHFRHISQSETYSNVECIICSKSFRYSSRNGPTNLARHISKGHGLNQPNTVTRRPFDTNTSGLNGSKRQKTGAGDPSSNSNSISNSSTNNNNGASATHNNAAANANNTVVSNNSLSNDDTQDGSNAFASVDANGSRLNGVQGVQVGSSNGVLDLGADSFHSSQLLGGSSGNSLVLGANKYGGHDYSDPLSRRIAITTPAFRVEAPHSLRGQNGGSLSLPQQSTINLPQGQSQQQQQQQQNQQVTNQQSSRQSQQRASASLDSQVVNTANVLSNLVSYDTDIYGNGSQNFSVIIQSLINAQSQLQQTLRNVERSNIRIEQKSARSANLSRGRGLDDKYELVPFASGLDPKASEPRLPLLYDIFTLFNCSNQVLDLYMSNYEIPNQYPSRQEKIFQLANFIGCGSVELYWEEYNEILRNVPLDSSKLD